MPKKNYFPIVSILIIAILIGILSGIVSLIFYLILNSLIAIMKHLYNNHTILVIIIPICAGLLIGVIRQYFLKSTNQGFSVAQVMYEVHLINEVVMKPLDVFLKILGTIISLISGFCIGKQGPIVHIGGAIGSNLAHYLKRDEDETRILIGCGVAGCLAGTFNAPIFATLFVVEVLFKKRYFDMMSTILLSAISSSIFVNVALKKESFISSLEQYSFEMYEIINFLILGISIGFISIIYIFSLRTLKTFSLKLSLSYIQKCVIGGIFVSFSLMFLSKYYTFDINPFEILESNHSISTLSIIIITYILLTSISIASGSIGGIFTPGIYIGAASGLLIAKILTILDFSVVNEKTYILTGMAAMFAGFADAPLTGTLMIVELTNQYNLLLPLLVATLSSSMITEVIFKESIYHQKLKDLLTIEKRHEN